MITTLFTIGYSGRSLDEFIALLNQYKITALCDVRSLPYSSRNPQFNREPLQQDLKLRNIEYVFLGEELGARSKDPSSYVAGKALYSKIAELPLFKHGLERIKLGVEKNYVLALMCAEKDPLSCHRSILICRNLRNVNIDIRHIIDNKSVESQSDLEQRLVKQLNISPDLFKDTEPSNAVERAYDIQGDRIAYVEKDAQKMVEVVREESEQY
ncbi:MAG: DUF488 domain-containing protein [Nitrospirae bacterium]|nr:DUF488 domain-containing protein [Nitrospirota bacterium]